jgi:Na+-transporting methylmalonyl-CoA/oxaloacetate decarboxylase gamma subunit
VLNAIWFVLGGMAITFATLTVLIVVMTLLNRWLGAPARTGPGGRG